MNRVPDQIENFFRNNRGGSNKLITKMVLKKNTLTSSSEQPKNLLSKPSLLLSDKKSTLGSSLGSGLNTSSLGGLGSLSGSKLAPSTSTSDNSNAIKDLVQKHDTSIAQLTKIVELLTKEVNNKSDISTLFAELTGSINALTDKIAEAAIYMGNKMEKKETVAHLKDDDIAIICRDPESRKVIEHAISGKSLNYRSFESLNELVHDFSKIDVNSEHLSNINVLEEAGNLEDDDENDDEE
jgi:hypothetical protein